MKMIKKIIFLFSITYCFILQSSHEDQKTKNLYRKLLSNRSLGLPASAIVGGGLAAGAKYLLHKNKFLSSFRAAEKIKHASYFKFVSAGAMTAVGLYELLKGLTKPKIDYSKKIKVMYICPGNLYSLFNSQEDLERNTVKNIEMIISKDPIQKYNKNEFWFATSQENYSAIVNNLLKSFEYAAALYLIHEDQKESFKNMFKEKLSEEKSLLYNLYKIDKPTSKDNLWCYALPLESYDDEKGDKRYSLQISSKITEENIDSHSFQLGEADLAKIKLKNLEIVGVDFIF
jgi:hypothetical protein